MKKPMVLALVSFIAASTLGVILLPSCGVVCTQIACFHTLKLQMTSSDGSPIEHFAGTASFDGGVVSFSCPSTLQTGYVCQNAGVILENIDWPKANVQVVANDGGLHATSEIEPRYEKRQPNGLGCGPECQAATHPIVLSR